MTNDRQEDRFGLDRDHYKRGTKYPENFEEKENYLKATGPTGNVVMMDVTDADGFLYMLVSDGTSGDKWTIEVIELTEREFHDLRGY
jgi:hypothetical protein